MWENIKKTIREAHLYPNEIEALIKGSIWGISWIGGILTLHGVDVDTRALGSSYFIFSLSLLMEFAPQIKKKTYIAKMIHALFCTLICAMLLLAFTLLVTANTDAACVETLYTCSKIVMALMAIDIVLLWLRPNESPENSSQTAAPKDAETVFMVQKFNESLAGGNLGVIKEGAHEDE